MARPIPRLAPVISAVALARGLSLDGTGGMLDLRPGDACPGFIILALGSGREGRRARVSFARCNQSFGLARMKCFSYNPVVFFSRFPAGVVSPLFDRLPVLNLAEEAFRS